MTLEQVFEQIALKNDLHVVDFSMNQQCSPEHRFHVNVHWTGPSHDGNPCEHGSGPTIAAALKDCLARARESRGSEPTVDFSEILKIVA